jgi:hypothetical protein
MSKERFESLATIRKSEGLTHAYALDVFGFELAKRQGYKDLDGRDAVHLYLINKHHWLPRDVRSMSDADMVLVLTEEMQGWQLPADALPAAGTFQSPR